jgi:hypothetical protein
VREIRVVYGSGLRLVSNSHPVFTDSDLVKATGGALSAISPGRIHREPWDPLIRLPIFILGEKRFLTSKNTKKNRKDH